MNGKYSVVQAAVDQQWDEFVRKSPQGTIFSESLYLSASNANCGLYYVLKGKEVKAAFIVSFNADRNKLCLDDLVIYSGILFAADNISVRPGRSRNEKFELTTVIVDWLDERYSQIAISLSPHFEDMRPFLWHKYQSQNADEKFTVDLRYTSYVDISELTVEAPEELTGLFRNLDTLRQRNIREARRNLTQIKVGFEGAKFIEYYECLMARQGETVTIEKLLRMKHLLEVLIQENRAVMLLSGGSDEMPDYITIFCFDNKRAYYLFGAGNPNSSSRFSGSVAFWDAFCLLARVHNVSEVDMEGVNSPKRGWFKLSFGGDLRPYHHVFKSVRM